MNVDWNQIVKLMNVCAVCMQQTTWFLTEEWWEKYSVFLSTGNTLNYQLFKKVFHVLGIFKFAMSE